MRRQPMTWLGLATAMWLGVTIPVLALDPPPACEDAMGWGLWATGRISPKVVNQGDIATITATIVGGPPAGLGCAYSQWALVGTSSVTVFVPGCFELVDYEPKADSLHNVSVSGTAVHWTSVWTPPPGSTVNDHCFCRSWGGGQWSETSTCPAHLSAGAWGPGAVFTLKVKATCAGNEDRWRKVTTMHLSGWWGIGWGNDAEDYYKIGGGEWVALTAEPTSAPADGTPVALSARVYEKNSGVAMPRETVSFSSLFGILQPAKAVTDESGIARATLSSPGNVTGPDEVMAKISSAEDRVTVQFTHVDNPPVDADSQLGRALALQLVGEPVHAGLGNYIYSKRLFDLPGKGVPFGFEVTYNSLDTGYNGPLGPGWTHAFNTVLTPPVPPATQVSIKWSDGHVDRFHDDGTGAFTPVGSNTPVKLTRPEPSRWVATLHNQNTYEFDAGGRLLAIGDLNGNRIVLTYSTTVPGQIDHITDTAGRQVTFTHDVAGRITAIASPIRPGSTVAFQYDAAGNLSGITDPRGRLWRFTYDGVHRLVTHVDAKGVTVITNAYDGTGRVVQQTDGAGGVTSYAYAVDAAGTTTTITPPSGHAVTHVYDRAYNLVRVVDGEGHEASFGADGRGQLTGAVDKNGKASGSFHDAAGNPLIVQDRTGAQMQISFDTLNRPTAIVGPLGTTTDTFGYDVKGNLTSVTNAEGRTASITVDASGLPTVVKDLGGGEWKSTYDASGLPQTVTDPTGVRVTLAHDSAGRVTQVTLPTGGATMQWTYDEAGHPLTRTDPLGNVTTFTYDDNGNLASQTFVPTGATTRFEYDWAGRPVKVTDPLGGITTTTYDVDGNVVSVTDADGITVTRQYDRANRLTSVTDALGHRVLFGHDANGNLSSVTNELGATWTSEHDAEGRPVRSTDPLGNQHATTYDAAGRVVAITDPLGGTQKFAYSKANRLIGTTLPDGGEISFINDPSGRPLYLSDPLGHFWMLAYDAAGRLTSRLDPNGKTESFAYDGQGRLQRWTQRDGTVITYAYDNASRLTTVTMPGQTVSYGYDAAGNVTSVTDGSGTTTMTYDLCGRRLGRTDPAGRTMAYAYTAAGRLRTLTYPDGHVVTYAHDAAGRLATATDWLGNQTVFQYDNASRVVQVTLPNGTKELSTYDAAGRLATRRSQTSTGTLIASYTYTRDAVGRIASVERNEPAALESVDSLATFAYDAANRVLTATVDGVVTSYAFDLRGNLTSKTGQGATTTYAYDALNRLVSVSDGVNTTTYAYDGAGNRVVKTHNGSTTGYVREGGTVYCTLDGSGAIQSYNVFAGLLLYSLDTAGTISVYHGDERGSVVAITDGSGTVLQAYAYDPYGKVAAAAGALASPFRFVGKRGVLADENGLYHMQARYYDPDARRFVTEDPLGLAAGLNLYAYAGGDPVNRVDPQGLDPIDTGFVATSIEEALQLWFERGAELGFRDCGYLVPDEDHVYKFGEVYLREKDIRTYVHSKPIQEIADQIEHDHLIIKGPPLPPEPTIESPPSPKPRGVFRPRNFPSSGPVVFRPRDSAPSPPAMVAQQGQPAGPGLFQRTLGNWRNWMGSIAARIAYEKVILRATVSYGVKMLGTDVATLAVGDIAGPVVISGAAGWFGGRGIGQARLHFDPATGTYAPVDQGVQWMMEPFFERSYQTVEPSRTTGKAWFDHIRQHTEYLDGLLNKQANW
ncbi:MAG: hypothetical protein KA072_09840 [Thermoanaerobaculaceae bacterium]|nr:hypothetical protein [Thermoanaerobaculaceae bacterium]MDI9622726.1 RHS repeat-associated core domain-containing protein [Acidobacteriota bacterium]NLH10047.1 hypothetical protein [Holophagae bacterium]HPW56069.1 RHS repeat-associated core domain-containing protein [Thermoanaerobaculaceae bacterium]